MYLSGDAAGARRWYDYLVAGRVLEHIDIGGASALSITDPDGVSSQAQTTAAALMFATLIDNDDTHGLALYLARRPGRGEAHLLEQIFYLQRFSPTGGELASFSYQLGGETIIQLLTSDTVRLSLNRSEFENADFTLQAGQVYADVYFVGSPEQTADSASRLIGLTKTLEPVGGVLEPGALVRVTLTPDLSAIDFALDDATLVIDAYIPTGMRFERAEPLSAQNWWLGSRQGQRLQFGASGRGQNIGGSMRVSPVIFYVRVATPGEFVVESAFISSATADTWGKSERSSIVVGG